MASSADQLANRLVSGGRAITRANRVGVEKACLAGKEVMLASAATAGLRQGGIIRGVGRRGSKFRVRYDVKGYQNPVGIIRMYGAAHLVNNDTPPHDVAPKRKKAMVLPDGGLVSGTIRHPGTKGKKFFERAEPVIVRQSERIIKQEIRSHLARTFAG